MIRAGVLKDLLEEKTTETARLWEELRSRDRMIVAILATTGPVQITDELVQDINDGLYTGVDYNYADGIHDLAVVVNPELVEADDEQE